jgi:peptide/nickel transport system permease protein
MHAQPSERPELPGPAGLPEAVTAATDRPARPRRLGFGARVAIAWLVVLISAAVLAPVLPLADPHATNVDIARSGPSADAPLGGDTSGRDVLSRTIWGARVSLTVGFGAVAIGFVVGGTLGLLAGYARGWVDALLGGAFDVMLSVPALILALAFSAFLGASVPNVVLALGIVSIPILGRITRASTLSWSARDFVLAARARGARTREILGRELLPNVLPAMYSIALLGVAVAIVAEGGLSLLGAGVGSEQISWGTLVASSRNDLADVPWPVLVPATAIFLTVLALNQLGDALRARLDVREQVL